MSADISICQIALIETGTERNSRNVVKSAARPIDWYFIFLRAISTTKRKARNGAKMKIAPIVYRISIAYTSVAFNRLYKVFNNGRSTFERCSVYSKIVSSSIFLLANLSASMEDVFVDVEAHKAVTSSKGRSFSISGNARYNSV